MVIAPIAMVLMLAAAQAPPQRPMGFEVASVKVNKFSDSGGFTLEYLPGGRFSAKGIPLRLLISEAYGLPLNTFLLFQSNRASLDPKVDKSLLSERYDIEAIAEKGAIPADSSPKFRRDKLRLMLQTLLADRFKLVAGGCSRCPALFISG